jgi:hypothetical protein
MALIETATVIMMQIQTSMPFLGQQAETARIFVFTCRPEEECCEE